MSWVFTAARSVADADTAVNTKAEDRNADKKVDAADELQARVDRNRFLPLMTAPWLSPRYRASLERYAGVLGPLIFGLVVSRAGSGRIAILAVAAFFVIGAAMLTFVNVERGRPAGAAFVAVRVDGQRGAERLAAGLAVDLDGVAARLGPERHAAARAGR